MATHPRAGPQGVPGPAEGPAQPHGAHRAAASIQLLVFGYAATFDLKHIPLRGLQRGPRRGVARAGGGASTARPPSTGWRTLHARRARSPRWSTRSDVLVVVHIGPRFSADLRRAAAAPLQVIVDGRNSNTALLALNYVRSHRRRSFNREWIACARPARRRPRAWRPAPGSTPTWRAAGSSCPASSACSPWWSPCWSPRCPWRASASRAPSTSCWSRRCGPVEILLGKALPGFLIGMVRGAR